MNRYYEFATAHGDFRIVRTRLGWVPTFDDEPLCGAFPTPDHALEELLAGHTDSTPFGTASELGISGDLDDWEELKG